MDTRESKIDGSDERAVVARHRAENPRSRAVGLFKFRRNGGTTKSMACVLCGAEGPTWCAKYRKTQRAERWEAEHRASHGLPWAPRASSRLMATPWAQERLARERGGDRATAVQAGA